VEFTSGVSVRAGAAGDRVHELRLCDEIELALDRDLPIGQRQDDRGEEQRVGVRRHSGERTLEMADLLGSTRAKERTRERGLIAEAGAGRAEIQIRVCCLVPDQVNCRGTLVAARGPAVPTATSDANSAPATATATFECGRVTEPP
jgi:hypothetical protein